ISNLLSDETNVHHESFSPDLFNEGLDEGRSIQEEDEFMTRMALEQDRQKSELRNLRQYISDLKQIHRIDSNEKHSDIQFPDGICVALWTPDGRLLNANRAFIDAFHLSSFDVQTKPHFSQFIHPKDTRALKSFQKILSGIELVFEGEVILSSFESEVDSLLPSKSREEISSFVSFHVVRGRNRNVKYGISHIELL